MHEHLGDLLCVCLHARGIHLIVRQLLQSLTQPCNQTSRAFEYQQTLGWHVELLWTRVISKTVVEVLFMQYVYCI